ncbi:MAG: glycosyltransferase family 2 protein [Pseudomonadota bacterium]
MNIYVIIVTYNGAPWIRGALQSLRLSDTPCTPVVVDNASGDDTVAIVRREFPEAIVVAQAANTGFGCGNNAGISLAAAHGADYIFLLNQDAFVTPAALGALAGFLERHPAYALASPLHCSPDLDALDPQTQHAYLQRHAPAYLSDACLGRARDHYEIRAINAAAWMVRTAAFRQIGGFDPIFFMYGEDDDWMTRCAHLGQRCALLPACRIVHLRAHAPHRTATLARQLWSLSERARSDLLLDMKHPQGKPFGKLLRLFSYGILRPLAQVVATHDWKDACAYLLATLRVLGRCRTVFKRARLCASSGPHFLDI